MAMYLQQCLVIHTAVHTAHITFQKAMLHLQCVQSKVHHCVLLSHCDLLCVTASWHVLMRAVSCYVACSWRVQWEAVWCVGCLAWMHGWRATRCCLC
jgi:hypothetical protein